MLIDRLVTVSKEMRKVLNGPVTDIEHSANELVFIRADT